MASYFLVTISKTELLTAIIYTATKCLGSIINAAYFKRGHLFRRDATMKTTEMLLLKMFFFLLTVLSYSY